MNHFFSVDYRMSRGNMHVDLQGYFDASAAKQLLSFINSFHKGTGRVFVSTAKLSALTESGTKYFKEYFSHTSLVASNLYIKGEQGLTLMPQGSKLILMKSEIKNGSVSKLSNRSMSRLAMGVASAEKKHKCSGNCKTCTCSHKKEKAHEM